jgi:hypothetical protein
MRGGQIARAIARQRGELPSDARGLDQFAVRMALVELTGSVARWANRLHDGLGKAGHTEAAAVFALSPPFADPVPTPGAFDSLDRFVAERVKVLQHLLAAEAG